MISMTKNETAYGDIHMVHLRARKNVDKLLPMTFEQKTKSWVFDACALVHVQSKSQELRKKELTDTIRGD